MSFKKLFKPDKLKVVVSLAFLITGVFGDKFYELNVLILGPLENLGFAAFILSIVLDFAIVYVSICIIFGIIKEVSKGNKKNDAKEVYTKPWNI